MKPDDVKRVIGTSLSGLRMTGGSRDAILHKAKGERIVKKKASVSLVFAIVLVCVSVTALALSGYFSVQDYFSRRTTPVELGELVVPIGKTFDNEYMRVTIGDAYFDSERFALTLNLESKDHQKPVYLYPKLRGYCGDRQLDIDVEGMRGDFMSGFLYPNLTQDDFWKGEYGFEGCLYEDEADGDVRWVFTMQVLAPNWPLIAIEPSEDNQSLSEQERDARHDAYMQRYRDAYDSRQILVDDGEGLWGYTAMLPVPEGMTQEEWWRVPLGDQLLQSGAFSLVETIECTYTTKLPAGK